jgi:hypothetical protein
MPRHPGPNAVQARWVLAVDQPPLERSIVTIAGRKIVAVGENLSGRPPRDLGDVALLPGLVNAHTHLELSLLDKPLGEPGMPFPKWIGKVVEYRRTQAKALMVETDGFQRFRRRAAERGLTELQAGATAAVGEIATPGWPRESFPVAGLYATIFLELLGLDASQQDSLLSMAKSFVDSGRGACSGPASAPRTLPLRPTWCGRCASSPRAVSRGGTLPVWPSRAARVASGRWSSSFRR